MKLYWTDSALYDLESLEDYVGADNRAAARSMTNRILNLGEKIHEPVAYRSRWNGQKQRWEVVVLGLPYVIIYKRDEAVIRIVRVLHQAQADQLGT